MEKKNVDYHFDINIIMAVKCALLETKKIFFCPKDNKMKINDPYTKTFISVFLFP